MHRSFSYDPLTGDLTRLVRMGNYAAGTVCRAKTTCGGYYKTKYRGDQTLVHRLIWELYTGTAPPPVIDHEDRDGLNNRWDNLRAADSSTNQMNIVAHSRNQLGIKGVFPIRGGTLYRAEVCVNGVRIQRHSKSVDTLVNWVSETRAKEHGNFSRN